MSWKRIWGIMLRHLYNFNHSMDRWVDAFYWPFIDVVVWGLAFSALQGTQAAVHSQVTMILCGLILWYVLWRGQYEVTINILEELWGANLVNILGSPLKVSEWIIALFALGIIKLVLTFGFISIITLLLYGVNIFQLNEALLYFIPSLFITGWIFGLCIGGLFLRYGTNIQSVAWAGAFLLMPFSATFYPVETLPSWAQTIAHLCPSSYIFEGMRAILAGHKVAPENIVISYVLNSMYFFIAIFFFRASFRKAKERGINHLK